MRRALSEIMELDLEKVCTGIESYLGDLKKLGIVTHFKDPNRGVSYNVDTDQCVSTVSFWPNGLCDSESILVATEQRVFKHYEFESEEIASVTIIKELEAAISRA